jgi:hypothetical protein
MAFTTISLTNGVDIKKAPIGFSWTTFFFGGWPAIIRQDWAWGVGILITGALTFGVAGMVAAFFYNKMYAKGLIDQGYYIHCLPATTTEEQVRESLGYFNSIPTSATVRAERM